MRFGWPKTQKPGASTLLTTLGFDPGASGGDIHNSSGLLWAPGTSGRTEDSTIRVTNYNSGNPSKSQSMAIDNDVNYLSALAFGKHPLIFMDGFEID
jgi:hypothetical protein